MKVFEQGQIGKMTVKNRFVHSPTYECLADDDGYCTPELIAFNREIAEGGVGLHTVSFAFVHNSGRHLKGQIGIHNDKALPGLSELAKSIKEGGARAFIQIAHSGPHANKIYSGQQSMGPSAMVNKRGGECRAMTIGEIEEAIGWFSDAARRTRDAGFDGVCIHASHGYLIGSFLSPVYNHREDQYGGSLENRARLFIEVFRAIRREVGPDYPIITKMNSEDRAIGGMTSSEMVETALLFQNEGIDAIELSVGINADAGEPDVSSPPVDPKTPENEGYFREAAVLYKKSVSTPLILVGGFRSLEGCEMALQSNVADFISLSRPLVREPNLIKRWMQGDTARAKCISCNLCRKDLFSGATTRLQCGVDMRIKNKNRN
ncbi:MAG: NADH:flavin oxidoreductase [Bacillota bacterium]|jgi:2,4-dienoyl-CoA reductase-like NADH-dependent reductase (Old Yellow Enzyme family)